MSKASTSPTRGRQARVGLRMLLAAGIVAVPTCLISCLRFIGVTAQVNGCLAGRDLRAPAAGRLSGIG